MTHSTSYLSNNLGMISTIKSTPFRKKSLPTVTNFILGLCLFTLFKLTN